VLKAPPLELADTAPAVAPAVAPPDRRFAVGDGVFDAITGQLECGGRTTRLRPRTAALLAYLLRHPDRVVGKDELLQAVWPDVVVTEDSLVQCVKEIRRAFGEAGRDCIRTVPRQGYAYASQPAATPAGDPVRHVGRVVIVLLLAVAAAFAAWLWLVRDRPVAAPPQSIVVLPLLDQTAEPGLGDAVDEMSERLTHALSRISGTLVIAPSTAFTYKGRSPDVRRVGADLNVRYVLEGALRRQGAHYVLTMRLADTSNAAQLWTEDFATESTRSPEVRDEVASRVASSLRLGLIGAEARTARERYGDASALELLTRARAALRWAGFGDEAVSIARPLLEQAVQIDDRLAEAWVLLAHCYMDEIRFRGDGAADLAKAERAASRGLALAPDSADANGHAGKVHYNAKRVPQALVAFDRAIQLNPNDPYWHGHRAAALLVLGRAEEALAPLAVAHRLSPRDPQVPMWQMFEGVVNLHLGRDTAAIDVLSRSVQGNPRSAFGHLFLASALGLAGRSAEAQAEVAELQRLRPGFTIGAMRAREPSAEARFLAQRERVYEGLRRAGLPE